jgi:hypothetical protein
MVRQLDASGKTGPLHGKTSGVILPAVDLKHHTGPRDRLPGQTWWRPLSPIPRAQPGNSFGPGRGGLADMSRTWRVAVWPLCVGRDRTRRGRGPDRTCQGRGTDPHPPACPGATRCTHLPGPDKTARAWCFDKADNLKRRLCRPHSVQ